MKFGMIAGFFSIVILATVTRGKIEMQKYLFVPSMYGRICKMENLLFNVSGLNSVGCSAHCEDRDGCVGVFYADDRKTCLGCQKFYTDVCGMNGTIIYTRAFYESTTINKYDENFGTHNMDSEGSGDCETTSPDVTDTTNSVTTKYHHVAYATSLL